MTPVAFIVTRINVGDYDSWKPMFDKDLPGTRTSATGWTLYRSVDDPGEVLIQIEFPSLAEAKAARQRLLASGVLDRFKDKTGPMIIMPSETVVRASGPPQRAT